MAFGVCLLGMVNCVGESPASLKTGVGILALKLSGEGRFVACLWHFVAYLPTISLVY
jgi:hypothetical protein